MRRLEILRRRLDQTEDIVSEAEKTGKTVEFDKAFRREMMDRITTVAIVMTAERQYLSALRKYIDLCRAVHGKIDRNRYDLLEDLRRMGVPPKTAREMADNGLLQIVVAANQT